MSKLLLPILFVFIFLYSFFKKINAYETFVEGVKGAIKLVVSIFPYVASILIAVSLLRVSGITYYISCALTPFFNILGIPSELCELIILRPFTGSGSYALLNDVITNYGPDSYITRCASVILGCSETIFYISTVYLSQTKVKKLLYAIPVALVASFFGAIVGCLLCKIM